MQLWHLFLAPFSHYTRRPPLWGHHDCGPTIPSAFQQSSVLVSAVQPFAVKLFTRFKMDVIYPRNPHDSGCATPTKINQFSTLFPMQNLNTQPGLPSAAGTSKLEPETLHLSSPNFSTSFFMQNLQNLRRSTPTGTTSGSQNLKKPYKKCNLDCNTKRPQTVCEYNVKIMVQLPKIKHFASNNCMFAILQHQQINIQNASNWTRKFQQNLSKSVPEASQKRCTKWVWKWTHKK